jgi:hypothetical protein
MIQACSTREKVAGSSDQGTETSRSRIVKNFLINFRIADFSRENVSLHQPLH